MRADITTEIGIYKMKVNYHHERGTTIYEVEWLMCA